jgi:GT2 family glycosyltransferase
VNRPAEVSLVFETANDQPHRRIRFADVVAAWKGQTRADRVIEWLVVSPREETPAEKDLLAGAPIRWLVRPGLAYYAQKNAGLAEARGELVAFADADALPARDWLERALDVLDNADTDVALVTGRSRYLSGPFSLEMALAQLGEQTDDRHETNQFLGHNLLLRAHAVRAAGHFRGDTIRVGADSDLAGRLAEAGYRLQYEPAMRATHHYDPKWSNVYRMSVRTGYALGRFQKQLGGQPQSRIWDFSGRMRVLLSRWRKSRRALGLSLWRFPLSVLFFVMYSVAFGYGYDLAMRGKPKPFASGQPR